MKKGAAIDQESYPVTDVETNVTAADTKIQMMNICDTIKYSHNNGDVPEVVLKANEGRTLNQDDDDSEDGSKVISL